MQRAGIGYDIHARAPGRPLVIGGVRFQGDWGLEGHSDADVLAHAIGDALLGAAALGDLGAHFPPGDDKWKDVSSMKLLRLIRAMVVGRGGRIVNVDATVVAAEPRLAPVRDAMRENIARSLKLAAGQVSVKATTNEALGSLGRGEVAMVEVAE
jgi:2-C-methyl-D-erythritol 2,4-cyclodiphosphate synthase